MKLRHFLAIALSCFIGLSHADTTCDVLAHGIKQDEYQFGSDQTRFKELQTVLQSDTYRDYSQASSSSFTLGVSLVDIVDVFLGTKSDQNSWGQNRSQFLNLSYDKVVWTSKVGVLMRSTQGGIVQTVADCAEKLAELSASGLFIYYNDLDDATDSFTIHAVKKSGTGSSTWKLEGFDYAPSSPPLTCTNLGKNYAGMTQSHTFSDGTVAFACHKSSIASVRIAITTDQGDAGTISLPSRFDLDQNLEARVAALETATVPENTVAFFNLSSCPGGWQAYSDAAGLYIRAMRSDEIVGTKIGQALDKDENRPTGEHVHGGAFLPSGGGTDFQMGHDGWHGTTGGTTGGLAGTKAVPGTNAPYIELLACQKSPLHVEQAVAPQSSVNTFDRFVSNIIVRKTLKRPTSPKAVTQ